jgi:hypothetical protein
MRVYRPAGRDGMKKADVAEITTTALISFLARPARFLLLGLCDVLSGPFQRFSALRRVNHRAANLAV